MKQEYVVAMIIDVDPPNRGGDKHLRKEMREVVEGTGCWAGGKSWEIKKIKSIKKAQS